MNNPAYWLYLEPYVHISLSSTNSLLYNTLNGKTLEYKNNPAIDKLIRKLESKKNLRVVKIAPGYKTKSPSLAKFIKDVRKHFMGDIIEVVPGLKKPVQMAPVLTIYKEASKLMKDESRSVGEGVMSYLNEISLYINDRCEQHCASCHDSYKQFLTCKQTNGVGQEFDLDSIINLIDGARGSSLMRINILGGNLLNYSRLDSLLEYLSSIPVQKVFYIQYLNIGDNFKVFDKLEKNGVLLNVLVSLPVDRDRFKKALRLINESGIKKVFAIILQKEGELDQVSHFIEANKNEDVLFQPYFNGRNLRFFKKHVFIKKATVLAAKPKLTDIFTRMKLNPSNFGKLIVNTNGDCYANINAAKLGNICRDTLYEIIYKETRTGKSWRRVRTRVEPCKRCLYSLLCPPLSNYEFAMKRNNLCKVLLEEKSTGSK